MRPDRWRLVKDLLQQALAEDRSARPRYLAGACKGDDDLRREVESLLLASEQSQNFMETPAIAWDREALAGERIVRAGPYRILREIGRGGMAAVYLASRDDGEYRKEVAIKVVLHPFASDFIVGRFRQERQILADLEHPNVARLLDGGTTDDGFPYLVLEHISGAPIDVYCHERQLSLTQRLELFCEVCSAVSYAHHRGVIHRDLKPGNVLVTHDGLPKLLDFGIAKLLGEREHSTYQTVTGLRLMTPEYSSPEQIRGEPVGVGADIYALGVVLYRLVTGRSPYAPENDKPHELARAICEDEPELRGLPRGVDAILTKALAKDPAARYLSVDHFADDVRRHLQQLPIAARRPRTPPHLWRVAKRRGGAILAATAFLSLAGLTASLLLRRQVGADAADARPMSVRFLTTLSGAIAAPAFSPDGKFIAFSLTREGDTGPEPGIYTVPVTGGSPVRITSGVGVEEWPSWSPDNRHIAFVREIGGASGIFLVPAVGGSERKLLELRDDRYFWLAWSPDGKYLAFADRDSPQEPFVLSLLSVDTRARRRLRSSSSEGSVLRFAFSPDGRTLAFIAGGAEKVDVRLLSLRDETTRSVYSQKEWIGGLTWTADGKALAVSLNQQGVRRLVKVSTNGQTPQPLSIAGEDAYYPAVSRIGHQLAFVREISDRDLWRVELKGSPARTRAAPFIRSTRSETLPQFSPDGKKIAFLSNRSGSLEIWVADADGGNPDQLTSFNGPIARWPSWSPDSRRVVVWAGALFVVPLNGSAPSQVNVGQFFGELVTWSHDGRWLYFVPADKPNIWRIPAQGGSAVQVTKDGAGVLRESPDGRFLYYSKLDRPGIWRIPSTGGQETSVIKEFQSDLLDYWDVVDGGIYYLDATTSPYPTITFLNLATRQRSPVAMLGGPASIWGGGLTVAPDRRSIVYAQRAYSRSEIILVDNFR